MGGAGHVGLPFGVVLAGAGHEVLAIDSNEERVNLISSGRSPFVEPGLDELLQEVLEADRFSISTQYSDVSGCDVVVVIVGTDLDANNVPQNHSITELITGLRKFLSTDVTLVLRSTVMPGTTSLVAEILGQSVAEVTFCPERIAEGFAIRELRSMPQLVGTRTRVSSQKIKTLFASLGVEVIDMSWEEAELGKLMLNAWRYTQFAVANEFAMICENYDVSYSSVRTAILQDYPRGHGLMRQGFAGGPCLRKDTLQLLGGGTSRAELLNAVLSVHQETLRLVIEEVVTQVGSTNKVVAQLGLTFKPESDDLRNSVALELARELQRRVNRLVIVEPHISEHPEFECLSLQDALSVADIVVVGTRHAEFLGVQVAVPIIDFAGHRLFNTTGSVR